MPELIDRQAALEKMCGDCKSGYDGGCGASIACNYISKEDAAEAWNRRVDLPEPPKE